MHVRTYTQVCAHKKGQLLPGTQTEVLWKANNRSAPLGDHLALFPINHHDSKVTAMSVINTHSTKMTNPSGCHFWH